MTICNKSILISADRFTPHSSKERHIWKQRKYVHVILEWKRNKNS